MVVSIFTFIMELVKYFTDDNLTKIYLAKAGIKILFVGVVVILMNFYSNCKDFMLLVGTLLFYTALVVDAYTQDNCDISSDETSV